MRHRFTIGFTLALWSAAVLYAGQTRPPDHPTPPPATRPDKEVSDLTKRVAAALPASSARRPFVARTLIDRALADAWARDKIPHAPLSNDYEFCRRVYLDLTGRIPTAAQLSTFAADTRADKRDR